MNDGDDNHQQPQPYRKRPKRTLENYNSSNIGFLEEEDASSAAEGGCEDNLMIDEDENDEQKNEENSQHSSSKSISEVVSFGDFLGICSFKNFLKINFGS